MKFHCDRCKTRYSIADDRVKGKILKIRCKNCAAVITVKEGDGDEAVATAAPAGPSQTGPQPRASSVAPAIPKAAVASGVRPAVSSPAVAKPAVATPALAGAFARAIKAPEPAPPPPSYEAEWYVSLDGEQFGPYTLARAQDWVASQAPGEELHCWSEGFDDWLPVEKVSHFRGRRASSRPSTRPPSQGEADLESEMTQVEGERLSTGPAAGAAGNARAAEVPAARGGRSVFEPTPKPLFARAMEKVAAEAPRAAEPRTVEDTPEPLRPAASRFGAARAASSPVPSRPGGIFGAASPAATAATTGGVSKPDEDGFEIGEASRVVNLAMLTGGIGGNVTGAHPRASGGLPGMARSTGGVEALQRTGGFDRVSPGASGDAIPASALAPKPRQYRLFVIFGAIGLLAVIGIVVVLFTALGGEGAGDDIVRGRGANETIAYQFEQAARKVEREAEEAERKNPTGRRLRKSPITAGVQDPPGTASSGDEVGFGGEAPRPLDGEDLMRVQQQNQLGLQMCFNRELKRDPYLKVPKAYVSLKVGLSGQVISVSIGALAGTSLGACLEGFIKRWRFPRTTEVFSGEFPVVFSSR